MTDSVGFEELLVKDSASPIRLDIIFQHLAS